MTSFTCKVYVRVCSGWRIKFSSIYLNQKDFTESFKDKGRENISFI